MRPKTLYITYMGLTEPLLYSQVLNYLKILSQKGISVCIFSYEKKQFITKSNIAVIKEDLKKYDIKWFFLKYHKRPQFLSKPYDIIRGVFFTAYLTLKERIDIIHARGTFCALIGIVPHLFLRKKMIFDLRGFMAEEYVDAGLWKKRSFAYRFIDKSEQYFINKADEIIVLTNKARDLLINRHKNQNVTVIRACVDLEGFNFKDNVKNKFEHKYSLNKKFVLIYTGSLGTWYMLSEMIDFYKELLDEEHEAVFIILSQTERAWIERQIPQALRKQIIIDVAKPKEVVDFLNLANIGISFIKPCFSKISSCPTKFGEYLSCGLPVIISKGIGDTEGIVRDNRIGVVVEDFSIEGYKKAIGQMKELLKEGEDLRRRCRTTAERYFSLKEGSDRYRVVYERLTH